MIHFVHLNDNIADNTILNWGDTINPICISVEEQVEYVRVYLEKLSNTDMNMLHLDFFKQWIRHLKDSGISKDLGIEFKIKDSDRMFGDMDLLELAFMCVDNILPLKFKINYNKNDLIAISKETVNEDTIKMLKKYSRILNEKTRPSDRPTTGGGGIERHPILGKPYIVRNKHFLMADYHTMLQYSKVDSMLVSLTNIPLVNSYSLKHPKNIFECLENYLGIENAYTD